MPGGAIIVMVASAFKSKIFITAAGVVFYMYREEIKDFILKIWNWVKDKISFSISITTRGNDKLLYALTQEIRNRQTIFRRQQAIDGISTPNYKLANAVYRVAYQGRTINITLSDDKIDLQYYVFNENDNLLKNFLDEIYQTHTSTENVILFYTSEGYEWGRPIFRRPRNTNRITQGMRNMLDDVNHFLNPETENEYENVTGNPYRRGYLVIGKPGTGKSLVAEIIAKEHNRPIYSITFNSKDMTDAVLINLISNVPANSLIVIDEFEKQYGNVKNNPDIRLSNAGILNAIDGPQRLSHGTIIILMANNIDNIDDELKIPLLRKGRIDKIYRFEEQV